MQHRRLRWPSLGIAAGLVLMVAPAASADLAPVLAETLTAIETLPPSDAVAALADVARVQHALSDPAAAATLQRARALVLAMPEDRDRREAVWDLIAAEAVAGDPAIAAQAALEARIAGDTYEGLALVAFGQARAGDADAALATAARVSDARVRITLLAALARESTTPDRYFAEVMTIFADTRPAMRSALAGALAIAATARHATGGDPAALLAAAHNAAGAPDARDAPLAIIAVARAEAATGDVDAARATLVVAELLALADSRGRWILPVLGARARVGDADGARAAAAALEKRRLREAAPRFIAHGCAEAGDIACARALLPALTRPGEILLIQAAIAAAQARACAVEDAHRTLEDALAAFGGDRDEWLDTIVAGQLAAGDRDGAAAIGALHTDPKRRADLLADALTDPTAMPEIIGGW